MEIVSPGFAIMDLKIKFALCEKSGVSDYWVVHPASRIVMVFKLAAYGEYGRPQVYSHEERVAVSLLGELEIDLRPVFA